MPETYSIAFFKDIYDKQPVQKQPSWRELVELLTHHERRSTHPGLWSPVSYRAGATRGNDGVELVHMVVLDIDDCAEPDDLAEQWRDLGLTFIVYSTWSHWREKDGHPLGPRWRAVFPLDAPVPASEWHSVHARVATYLAGTFWDPACSDPARMMFLPACPPDAPAPVTMHNEGRCVRIEDAPELPPARAPEPARSHECNCDAPGGDYNTRGDHRPVLEAAGWSYVRTRGNNEHWRRPGKTKGMSGTWHIGQRKFYCFTSSTSLDPQNAYSLFALKTHFEHSGNFSEAAKALYQDGYGNHNKTSERPQYDIPIPNDDDIPWEYLSDESPAQNGNGKSKSRPTLSKCPEELWDPPAHLSEVLVPPFPLDVLPSWLADFCVDISEGVQVPLDLPAMIGLAVLSAAARGRYNIEAPAGHEEPVTLYVLIALPPGERKSSVFGLLRSPVEQYEAEEIERMAPELEVEQTRQNVAEKRLEHLRSKAAKENDDAQRSELLSQASDLARQIAEFPPCSPLRLLADDVTPEELVHLLAEQEGRLSLLSAEGGIFDIISGLYSEGRSNIDGVLKAYDGEPIRVDRRSRKPLFVPRAVLTMGLAVQPDVIKGLASSPKFRGRGLIGRFTFVLPVSKVGTRDSTRPLSEMIRRRYDSEIQRILCENAPLPTKLTCCKEALDELQSYAAALEPRLKTDLATVTDWAGKLPGRLARIAALLHLADGEKGPICRETMARALRLGPYLIDHAMATFALMGADPELDAAQRVLAWLEKECCDQFTARECFIGVRSTVKKMSELWPILKILEDHNYIREIQQKKRDSPGRNSSASYEVNPLWR